jgi:hypothetical protein
MRQPCLSFWACGTFDHALGVCCFSWTLRLFAFPRLKAFFYLRVLFNVCCGNLSSIACGGLLKWDFEGFRHRQYVTEWALVAKEKHLLPDTIEGGCDDGNSSKGVLAVNNTTQQSPGVLVMPHTHLACMGHRDASITEICHNTAFYTWSNNCPLISPSCSCSETALSDRHMQIQHSFDAGSDTALRSMIDDSMTNFVAKRSESDSDLLLAAQFCSI